MLLTACGPASSGGSAGQRKVHLPRPDREHHHHRHSHHAVEGPVRRRGEGRRRSRPTSRPARSAIRSSSSSPGRTHCPTCRWLQARPSLMKQFIDAGQVVDLSDGARQARRRRQDPAGRRVDDQGPLRRGRRCTRCPPSSTSRASGTTRRSSPTTASRLRRRGTTSSLPPETLKAAGVQPFAADGKDGWPITRLVGNYIARDLGPDALQGCRRRQGQADRRRVREGRRRGREAGQGRLLRRRGRFRSTTTPR